MPLYRTKPMQFAEGSIYIRVAAERMHVTMVATGKMINITPCGFVQAGDPPRDGIVLRFPGGYHGMEYVRPVKGVCTFELDFMVATDSLRVWAENPTPPVVYITANGVGSVVDGTRTYRIIHLYDDDCVQDVASRTDTPSEAADGR